MIPYTDKDQEKDFKGILECPAHLLKLDLGCGNSPKEGFQSVDISEEVNPGYIANLFEYPWQWKADSVFALYASHFVEHVPDLIPFFNEAYRVLCDKGTFEIIVPYLTSRRAFQDPTHKQFLSENAFQYYNAEWRKANKLEHYKINTNFKVIGLFFYFDAQYQCLTDDAKTYARIHYWDAVSDLRIVLQKEKF